MVALGARLGAAMAALDATPAGEAAETPAASFVAAVAGTLPASEELAVVAARPAAAVAVDALSVATGSAARLAIAAAAKAPFAVPRLSRGLRLLADRIRVIPRVAWERGPVVGLRVCAPATGS